MTNDGSLSLKQRKAVAALIQVRTVAEAAELAGCGERSIYRWLQKDDAFQAALRGAETQAISESVRSMVTDMGANHQTMRDVRDDPENSAGVRLRAAGLLDGSLLRWRELLDMEERLARLERAIYG